ncbi:hypothetical protein FRC19_005231 [Serendipita sp. 401]|nr:hypothetical protein FRC19_005231 [Serendipita sp. 401]
MAQGIHDGTKLLLSSIELPEYAHLHYSIYVSRAAEPLEDIESARRKLSNARTGDLFAEPICRIHFENGLPLLYVFHVTSGGEGHHPVELPTLTRKQSSQIVIGEAVMAHTLCSEDHGPCTCCHNKPTIDQATKDSNLAENLFLATIRDILVDEICAASRKKGHIPAVKLRHGFCLLSRRMSTEWTQSWSSNRDQGLIYCQIRLYLTSTHILIQPVAQRINSLATVEDTTFGAPIVLLPYGIPAFYLGQQLADDRTVCEFSDTLGHKADYTLVSENFIQCYIPFHKVNERQDGGIKTIWPKELTLSMPLRPPLNLLSDPSSTLQLSGRSQNAPTTSAGIALSLLSLTHQSTIDLSTLSNAMGQYIDSVIKEREKPKMELSHDPSVPQNRVIPPSSSIETLKGQSQTPHLVALEQNYPSPLEMVMDNPRVSLPASPPSNPQEQTLFEAAEAVIHNQEIVPSMTIDNQPHNPDAYPTSQNVLDSWDTMDFGGDSFDFAGTVGMGLDPFSSTAPDTLTDDDFKIFDLPSVPVDPSGATAPGVGSGDVDMLIALAGGSNRAIGLEAVDTSMMDWNIINAPVPFSMSGESDANAINLADAAQMLQSNFGIDVFGADLQSILLAKTPATTVDGLPSAQSLRFPQATSSPIPLLDPGEDDQIDTAGFVAVPFGKLHNVADERYVNGKYSLPSPPPEKASELHKSPTTNIRPVKDKNLATKNDRGPWKSSTARDGELRARYLAATQPSSAMLYKLAGTKRIWEKMQAHELDSRTISNAMAEITLSPTKKRRLTWSTGDEAWRNPTPPQDGSDDGDDGDSSMAGDDDLVDEGDAISTVGLTQPVGLRSEQNLPNQDPVQLLQSRFDSLWLLEHRLVSSSEISLQGNTTLTNSVFPPVSSVVPMSVPTPVSPEAIPGEGGPKLTIGIARHISREVVRNPMWRAVAIAFKSMSTTGSRNNRDLCRAELDILTSALRGARQFAWGKTVAEIGEIEDEPDRSFSTPQHVNILTSPKLTLGYGTNVIDALPTILRFWEQMDIVPLHGPKDVHAVAFVSDTGGVGQITQAEAWLKRLGKLYTARRLGTHTAIGNSRFPNGVAAVRWDSFRAVCERLIATQSPSTLVAYVVVPNGFANLTHPSALGVLSTISDINEFQSLRSGRVIFRLVPEVFVSHFKALSHSANFGMERIVLSVYDSIPISAERQHSRLSANRYQAQELTPAFAFKLSSRSTTRARFVERWPPPIATIFDRYAFVHIAYSLSPDGEWLVAFVCTENGDAEETEVWRIDDSENYSSIVRHVLDLVFKFVKRADLDWRVTVTKAGLIPQAELDAWTYELDSQNGRVSQPMHLTLLCITLEGGPVFLDALRPSEIPVQEDTNIPIKEYGLLVDAAHEAFMLFPRPTDILSTAAIPTSDYDFLSHQSHSDSFTSFAIPISTCWMVHIHRPLDWTRRQFDSTLDESTSSGYQIHALHLARFGGSTYSGETGEHMKNIATSFHDLTTLKEVRYGHLGGEVKLPLHLAIVEAISGCLGGLQIS